MSIYKKLSRMDGSLSLDERLYLLLSSEKYKDGNYTTRGLGEGMGIVFQDIWGWWKPRFVLNHDEKTAFEFMDGNEHLMTVTEDDIVFESLWRLPESAVHVAQIRSFHFPSFIRGYRNGVSQVDWQLNPDGRYYMDDSGYGMTRDKEIEIYGFIDKAGNVAVKFRAVADEKELDDMRQEAEVIVNARTT